MKLRSRVNCSTAFLFAVIYGFCNIVFQKANFKSLNQTLKTLLIITGMCVLSLIAAYFVNLIFNHLGDWTMSMNQIFLVHNLSIVDLNLIRWFPLLIALILNLTDTWNTKTYFKIVLWTLSYLLIFLSVGIAIALFTWTNTQNPSPLLPQYLSYQPFSFYWTVFITLGITLPILFHILKRKHKTT